MNTKLLSSITTNLSFALVASLTIVTLLFATFILVEPQIGHSAPVFQEDRTFTVRQTITAEASFQVDPPNVVMDGDINGVTGGNATGTTQFVVSSNDGFYVAIDFFDNVGQYTMLGDETASEDILDFNFGGSDPVYGFTPNGSAQFGYTVTSSSTSEIPSTFQHNNTDTCGGDTNTTPDRCWMTPSTTEYTIMENSGGSTRSTSTIKFKVNVPSGASPQPSPESYTATATLSLYIQ